jgi:ABC-type Fe3+ transport system permease subunit
MNTYFRSLYYGIAIALGFIGLFGFAIDNEQWRVSVWLIIIGVVMARLTYGMRNRE